MTLCFAKNDYVHSFCQNQAFSYRWCCLEMNMKTTERDCFFSIFQMNDRFMEELKGGDEEYEYANMQLIVTKCIKMPPKTGQNRIDKMTAGKYFVFYTANFSAS